MKKNYQITFLGPQGSGKGTQAELLAKKLNLPIIVMGNILREQIKKKTVIGKKIEKIVDSGRLIPSEITNQLMVEEIKKQKNGFIIDGYPREIVQAKFLTKIANLTQAIEITLSDQEAIKRIGGRRSCSCGEVYHLKYNPPKKVGLCDKCGKKLFVRDDDELVAIKKRLKIYRHNVIPLEKLYKKQKILIKVDGRPSIQKIHQKIIKNF